MDDGRRSLEVQAADAGRRLDLFLAEWLSLSRAETRRLLARGAVRVAGRVVDARAKGVALRPGDQIEVACAPPPSAQRPPAEPDAPLTVLARGPGWLALDKPAGMAVHPLEPGETGTLLGAAIAHHPQLFGVGEGGLRSGVVHRLDVDTSGALLLATREAVWQRLRRAFREHRVRKRYRAIVLGSVAGDGEVELPLVVARRRPALVRCAKPRELPRARVTQTSWRVLESLRGATLLEVRTRTGFLHQVRATFAHLGHPLAGDRSYGPAEDPSAAPRHMLHAAELAFEEIRARSPDPEDFAALRLALSGSGHAP